MWSDKDPDVFLYKKDQCHDCLYFATSKEGPSDRQYDDIIFQCLLPEYDKIRQTHFERENCNLTDIPRMMLKIYADNLARSNSDLLRGIASRLRHAGDGAGPQQHKFPLLQRVRPLQERLHRL